MLEAPADVLPDHVFRRVDDLNVRSFGEIYEFLESDVLVSGKAECSLTREWKRARADSWSLQPESGESMPVD